MTDLETLRFPVGRFSAPDVIDHPQVTLWIDEIERLPADLRRAVEPLDDAQLDTRYREEGWTLRQVVHHMADSNLNSYVRFKWALTEEEPTIKAYNEKAWAELADARAPVELSLALLERLHVRWVVLLRALGPDELARGFVHPETDSRVRLDANIGIYAWHGRHHLAHVTELARREGWG